MEISNADLYEQKNGSQSVNEEFLACMEKLEEKIENGDTEQKFQIGSQSFTIKEWETFLKKFDSAEDAIKELMEEKIEKRRQAEQESKMKAEAKQKSEAVSDAQVDMLTSETVQARFPLEETEEDGNPKEELYLIAIDKNGIRCSKPGTEEYEWEIVFTDESQYEMAAAFMDWAYERMDNFLFAAHENFWEDYLNGNMDVGAFQDFLADTNNGIPDYSITVGDSVYVDKSKMQWAQYMNPLGTKLYTAEEMLQMQDELIQKNLANAAKITDFI
jgi:hypothetical protein